MNKINNQITGILWMLCHCLLISILSAMIRAISEKFHIFEIVFFHNAVAFLLILPFIIKTGARKNLKTEKLGMHVFRAVLGVVSLSMYFYAITIIPLTQARAIALAGPLISSLFAILFLKEKSNRHKSLALFIGFAGSILTLEPEHGGFSYATLMVIVAVCMWSVIDMIIKILSNEATATQLFYLTGIMTILSIPGAIYYWQTPSTIQEWLWMISLGVVFLLNITAIFYAFKHADVTTIMPFDFTGMIFTAVIAYFAFSEIPQAEVIAGSVVIAASSIYIIRKEAINSKKEQVPQLLALD